VIALVAHFIPGFILVPALSASSLPFSFFFFLFFILFILTCPQHSTLSVEHSTLRAQGAAKTGDAAQQTSMMCVHVYSSILSIFLSLAKKIKTKTKCLLASMGCDDSTSFWGDCQF
jgi:hypothetical protein